MGQRFARSARYSESVSDDDVDEDDSPGNLDDEEPSTLVSKLINELKSHPFMFVGVLLALVVGVAGGMILEGWACSTSVYVFVQIITTIGYGDFTTTNEPLQVFVAIYVLFCLVIVANFLNVIVGVFVEAESETIRRRLRQVQIAYDDTIDDEAQAKKNFGKVNEFVAFMCLFAVHIAFGTIFYRLTERCTCSYGRLRESLPDCIDDQGYEKCVDTGGFTQTWASSFYMSVITLTTVGFGDYSPKTKFGRWVGVFWMISGVASTGLFLAAFANLIRRDKEDTFDDAYKIDPVLFQTIDESRTGFLSKAEFRSYFFISHKLVPEQALAMIDEKFEYLKSFGPPNSEGVSLQMVQAAANAMD